MIKRLIMIMLLLFNITFFVFAQDVRYYKLTRKVENGTSSTNVSGGQFITFTSDICFESNNHGVGVDHGTLKRNAAYSNSQYSVYQGSSYWGKDATFKFNADKSVLNVVLENGDVYLYKRATAPAGQETCSLIRKSEGGDGGTVVVTPPPVNPPQGWGGYEGGGSTGIVYTMGETRKKEAKEQPHNKNNTSASFVVELEGWWKTTLHLSATPSIAMNAKRPFQTVIIT